MERAKELEQFGLGDQEVIRKTTYCAAADTAVVLVGPENTALPIDVRVYARGPGEEHFRLILDDGNPMTSIGRVLVSATRPKVYAIVSRWDHMRMATEFLAVQVAELPSGKVTDLALPPEYGPDGRKALDVLGVLGDDDELLVVDTDNEGRYAVAALGIRRPSWRQLTQLPAAFF